MCKSNNLANFEIELHLEGFRSFSLRNNNKNSETGTTLNHRNLMKHKITTQKVFHEKTILSQ